MKANETPVNELNRRAARRHPIEAPATLWLDDGWQQVICCDISSTGAGLTSLRPDLSDLVILPDKGHRPLRVTLRLPECDLHLTGTPVRRATDRLGLRFGELDESVRDRLDRLMDSPA